MMAAPFFELQPRAARMVSHAHVCVFAFRPCGHSFRAKYVDDDAWPGDAFHYAPTSFCLLQLGMSPRSGGHNRRRPSWISQAGQGFAHAVLVDPRRVLRRLALIEPAPHRFLVVVEGRQPRDGLTPFPAPRRWALPCTPNTERGVANVRPRLRRCRQARPARPDGREANGRRWGASRR